MLKSGVQVECCITENETKTKPVTQTGKKLKDVIFQLHYSYHGIIFLFVSVGDLI